MLDVRTADSFRLKKTQYASLINKVIENEKFISDCGTFFVGLQFSRN